MNTVSFLRYAVLACCLPLLQGCANSEAYVRAHRGEGTKGVIEASVEEIMAAADYHWKDMGVKITKEDRAFFATSANIDMTEAVYLTPQSDGTTEAEVLIYCRNFGAAYRHGLEVPTLSSLESSVSLVRMERERKAARTARRAQAPVTAAPPAAAPASFSDVDSPQSRGAARPDDFALVVGIEKYSRLPEARFAENDADAVKKHLLAQGYPERNIVVLKGGQATRGAIQGYVEEWLPKNTKPSSRVFVYFSGHGSPDAKTGDAYLVPWDGDAMFLKSTAYPLKSLYASLGRLKAKHVLVALDSCFSGAGGRSVLAEGARPLVSRVDETAAPAGVTVLSAASGDEITATIAEQSHGAFTYYLLKAFNAGKLTARTAYTELKPQVQDEAHRQNREQTPLLLGDDAPF